MRRQTDRFRATVTVQIADKQRLHSTASDCAAWPQRQLRKNDHDIALDEATAPVGLFFVHQSNVGFMDQIRSLERLPWVH
jgi:hypothetical protein